MCWAKARCLPGHPSRKAMEKDGNGHQPTPAHAPPAHAGLSAIPPEKLRSMEHVLPLLAELNTVVVRFGHDSSQKQSLEDLWLEHWVSQSTQRSTSLAIHIFHHLSIVFPQVLYDWPKFQCVHPCTFGPVPTGTFHPLPTPRLCRSLARAGRHCARPARTARPKEGLRDLGGAVLALQQRAQGQDEGQHWWRSLGQRTGGEAGREVGSDGGRKEPFLDRKTSLDEVGHSRTREVCQHLAGGKSAMCVKKCEHCFQDLE